MDETWTMSLGDYIEICLEHTLVDWRVENYRSKSDRAARELHLRGVKITTKMLSEGKVQVLIEVTGDRRTACDNYYYAAQKIGHNLYRAEEMYVV